MGQLFEKDFALKCGECQSSAVSGLSARSFDRLATFSKVSYDFLREHKQYPECLECHSQQIILEFPLHFNKNKTIQVQTCLSSFLCRPEIKVHNTYSPHQSGPLHFSDLQAANSFRSQTYQTASGRWQFPVLLRRMQDSTSTETTVGAYWEFHQWNIASRHDLAISREWNDLHYPVYMLIPAELSFFTGVAAPSPTTWKPTWIGEAFLGGGHQVYIPKHIAQLCFEANQKHSLREILQKPKRVFKEALAQQEEYNRSFYPSVYQAEREKKVERNLFTKSEEFKRNFASEDDPSSDAQSFLKRNELSKRLYVFLIENEMLLAKFSTLQKQMLDLQANVGRENKHNLMTIPTEELKKVRSFLKFYENKFHEKNKNEKEKDTFEQKWKKWLLHNREVARKNLEILKDNAELEKTCSLLGEEDDDPICPKCGHRASEHPVLPV